MREANCKQIFFLVVVINVVALPLPFVGAGVVLLRPLHECHVLKQLVPGGRGRVEPCGRVLRSRAGTSSTAKAPQAPVDPSTAWSAPISPACSPTSLTSEPAWGMPGQPKDTSDLRPTVWSSATPLHVATATFSPRLPAGKRETRCRSGMRSAKREISSGPAQSGFRQSRFRSTKGRVSRVIGAVLRAVGALLSLSLILSITS